MELSAAELHRKFTVVLYIHRRCGCVIVDPDIHEKVCFDPPVQLELTPLAQYQFETLTGGK